MKEFGISSSFPEFQKDTENYQEFLSLETEEIKKAESLVQVVDCSNFVESLLCLVYISYFFILRSEYVKLSPRSDLNNDGIIDLRQTQVILITYLLSNQEKLVEALRTFHKEEYEDIGFMKKMVLELFSIKLKDTVYADETKQLWESFKY